MVELDSSKGEIVEDVIVAEVFDRYLRESVRALGSLSGREEGRLATDCLENRNLRQ